MKERIPLMWDLRTCFNVYRRYRLRLISPNEALCGAAFCQAVVVYD